MSPNSIREGLRDSGVSLNRLLAGSLFCMECIGLSSEGMTSGYGVLAIVSSGGSSLIVLTVFDIPRTSTSATCTS